MHPRHRLAPCAIAIACFALPAAAGAETVVPPENSAATQYTEAIPTGGGREDAGKTGGGKKATPAEVLGAGKAKKLKQHGNEGRAAAEVAAETAPTVTTENAEPPAAARPAPPEEPPASGDRGQGQTRQAPKRAGGDGHAGSAPPRERPAESLLATDPQGSSGFGEVLGQATGSSASGQLGLWLPLLILGTVIWSLLFAWRQRRHGE